MTAIQGAYWFGQPPDQHILEFLAQGGQTTESASHLLMATADGHDTAVVAAGVAVAGRVHPLPLTRTAEIVHVSTIAAAREEILRSKGASVTRRVWGRYVIAIADDEQLLLCRDPMGLATLFYSRIGDTIFFATEALTLRRIGRVTQFDTRFLAAFLLHGLYTTARTPFPGIKQVPPGHVAVISRRGLQVRPFWRFIDHIEQPIGSIRDTFVSVVANCGAESKGIYLDVSGGLDSSALLAATATTAPAATRVIAATLYHPSTAAATELTYAQAIADRHAVRLLPIDGEQHLPFTPITVHRAFDTPSPHLLHLHLHVHHAALARELGCDIFMNGFGGDQVFQASTRSPLHTADSLFRCWFRSAVSSAELHAHATHQPLLTTLGTALGLVVASRRGKTTGLPFIPDNPEWCAPHMVAQATPDVVPPDLSSIRRLPPSKVAHIMDIYHCAAQSDRGYRGSMMEHPFLAQPLVEAALALPTEQLYSATADRIAFREALADLLPDEIRERQTKGEYSGMYYLGLRRHAARIEELLLSGWLVSEQLVDATSLRAALRRAAHSYAADIWPILNACAIELWMRQLPSVDTPAQT